MWCRLVTVLSLIVIVKVCCADNDTTEDLRTGRNFDLDQFQDNHEEKWHAVNYRQPETEDWIPGKQSEILIPAVDDEPMMKRRRPGRKRKRRPQNTEHDLSNNDRLPSTRSRPRRPQQLLDSRREQWRDEMMAEEPFRPTQTYTRRRQYPKYEEFVPNDHEDQLKPLEPSAGNVRDSEQISRRRPNLKRTSFAEKETNENSNNSQLTITDLKTLLKQSGGISLSELLQQRNLSLVDLLKGEQQAISALTSIPEQTSQSYEQIKDTEDETRNLNKQKRYNSGRRRLPPGRKYTRITEDVLNYEFNSEISSENTTERRIFVPSHPKYYTSVDYKPKIKDLNIGKTTTSISNTITTEVPEKTSESISIVSSTVTFSTSDNLSEKNKFTLPPTNANLKNFVKSTMKSIINNETEDYTKTTMIPQKAIRINLNELFEVSKLFTEPVTESTSTTEGPMKISVDLEQILKKSKLPGDRTNAINTKNALKNFMKVLDENVPENGKTKDLSARDEIMEILSDSVSRENLTRLLELRNMTLEELVEQRERGSSQRHLADIFHNKTKEPEPLEATVDQFVQTNENSFLNQMPVFDTFPKFNNQPSKSHYFSSVIELPSKTRESRENQFSAEDSHENNFIGNPVFRATTAKSNEIIERFIPIWRQAYTDMQKKSVNDNLVITDEAQRIEEIENKLAEAVNDALNIDVINEKTYNEENEFYRLPYGVRSAIIASAVIIGFSLVVFLTIFIIFKWTQMRRKRLTYINSFSNSKIKTPILETPYQRRTFGTIVNATLGRKKNISTISCGEPHSLQEYLWNDRKQFH